MALLTAYKLNLNLKKWNALQNLERKKKMLRLFKKKNPSGIVEELQTNKVHNNVTQQLNKNS